MRTNAMASQDGMTDSDDTIATLMHGIGAAARKAARVLSLAQAEQKARALMAAAKAVRAGGVSILAANARDIAAASAAVPDGFS